MNMVEESSFEFRLKKIDETRHYLLDEIKYNDLMSEKYKKTCKYLNYVEHLLILVSTVICCVSIFAVGIKICEITAGIKKYKAVMKIGRRSMIKYCYQEKQS